MITWLYGEVIQWFRMDECMPPEGKEVLCIFNKRLALLKYVVGDSGSNFYKGEEPEIYFEVASLHLDERISIDILDGLKRIPHWAEINFLER